MGEAAKGCATNPQDSQAQINLKKAAEKLKNATTIRCQIWHFKFSKQKLQMVIQL
jgi:hypothetical protein